MEVFRARWTIGCAATDIEDVALLFDSSFASPSTLVDASEEGVVDIVDNGAACGGIRLEEILDPARSPATCGCDATLKDGQWPRNTPMYRSLSWGRFSVHQ